MNQQEKSRLCSADSLALRPGHSHALQALWINDAARYLLTCMVSGRLRLRNRAQRQAACSCTAAATARQVCSRYTVSTRPEAGGGKARGVRTGEEV